MIQAPSGQVALIDGGDSSAGVLPYLKASGVERIDLLLATHPHSDHIGGLIEVLSAIPVEEVVTNGQIHTTLTYERFLDAIAEAGSYYTEVRRGDSLALGALSLDILHPTAPVPGNLNDQSIALRLIHGDVTFLFTGDAEHAAEASMLASEQPLQADVLKVGHHGSRSASSPAFLAAVRPVVAVYTAGPGNSYGHPHPETLERLAAVGATIYGTDVHGTVIISSDRLTYRVETERQGSPRAPPTPVPPPTRTAPVATSAPVPTTYTIQPGDSLSRIASQFGVPVAALAALNDIADPSMIRVGQVLLVPSPDYAVPERTAAPTEAPVATVPPPPAPPPTAIPEATATPAPAPEPLTVEVVSLTSPISPGANASLTIRTVPGAACTITVYYKSGASEAAGLGPQNTNADGLATWQWKVGTRTTPGLWRIVVTSAAAGQRSALDIPFEVR